MALAGFACADTISVDHSKDNITVISNDNHSHDSDGDECTILCPCNCCHASFTPMASFQLTQPRDFPQLYIPYFQNFKDIEISDFLIPPIS